MNQKIFQVNNLHFYFRILFNDNKLFDLSFSENKNDLMERQLSLKIMKCLKCKHTWVRTKWYEYISFLAKCTKCGSRFILRY